MKRKVYLYRVQLPDLRRCSTKTCGATLSNSKAPNSSVFYSTMGGHAPHPHRGRFPPGDSHFSSTGRRSSLRREDRAADRTVGNPAEAVATATSPSSLLLEGARDTELSTFTPTPCPSQFAVPDFSVKEVIMVWGVLSRVFRRVDSLRLGAR